MKVKNLIKELEKLDQESEVTIGGSAIYCVEQLPGYYDGYYEKLIEDESKKPFYSVIGIEFTRANTKVELKTLDVSDILWNCDSEDELDKIIIKFDPSLGDFETNHAKERIEKIKIALLAYFKKEDNL
jgi:hypothetical protein